MPKQVFTISLLFFLLFFPIFSVKAEQIDINPPSGSENLILADCEKCHRQEFNDLDEAGLAHQTELTCTDCHKGHRPKSFDTIPKCSQCHSGEDHYRLQQCLNCHRNPHRPRQIRLPKKARQECLTCHQAQEQELVRYPSYHSELVCTDCHQYHGQMPSCMSCHQGHNRQMTEAVCQNCHQPHKPLDVSYADTTPSTDCSGCHQQAATDLEQSKRKHRLLKCADCHRQRHKTIPLCSDCHGSPHAEEIVTRFPACGGCHGTAHSLR